MRRVILGLLTALVAVSFVPGFARGAQAATVIDSATVQNSYPTQLVFKVSAHADSNITDVTLNYAITGRGTSAIGKPKELTPGLSVSAEVVIQVNSGSSYIPVGSEFVYNWDITTADGAVFKGPEAKFFFLPPGQDWKSVAGDFMTVYYHGDKQALATTYLQAGVATFDKIAVRLLKTQLKQLPVRVIMFDDEKESDPARPGSGKGKFDATVTTCGTKVTSDIILLIPQACGSSDRTDTLRHEFTHIINQAAAEGPFGKLPSWLDEGTAVYGQTSPGSGFTDAFESAVRGNRLLSVASMGVATSDASQVNLFYGQSHAMVKYLLDKGADKYAQFFATIKAGARFDAALQQIYGVDLAGFENEFRAANGLPARANPTAAPSPTTAPRQEVPTRAPTARPPVNAPANSDEGGGIGTTTLAIGGAAVLFVLLAVLSFLASMVFQNNRARAAASRGPADRVDRLDE